MVELLKRDGRDDFPRSLAWTQVGPLAFHSSPSPVFLYTQSSPLVGIVRPAARKFPHALAFSARVVPPPAAGEEALRKRQALHTRVIGLLAQWRQEHGRWCYRSHTVEEHSLALDLSLVRCLD